MNQDYRPVQDITNRDYRPVHNMPMAVYNEEMASLNPKTQYSSNVSEVSYGKQNSFGYQERELPDLPVQPLPKESLFQGIRRNTRLFLWGLAMSTASIMTGYEQVFTGAITEVPAFNAVYGGTYVDYLDEVVPSAMWIALWAISAPLGASVGSGLGGWTLDKIGRRYTLAIATIWLTFSPFISFFSDRLSTAVACSALYFIGKLIQGVGVGAMITVLLAYTSEILPPSIKGSILALHVPMTLVGNLIGAVALKKASNSLSPTSYRLPMAGQWFLLIIPVLLLIFLPESPVWSIRQNRISQAKAGCRKLQGPAKNPNDDMFPRLMEVVAGQEKNKAHMEIINWSELFKTKSDMHRTFVVVFTAMIPTLLGVPFLSHAGLVGQLMGMTKSLATSFFLIGSIIAVIGSVLAFFVVPAIGRRFNVLFSSVVVTIVWLGAGIAGCFLGKKGPPVHGVLTASDNAITKYIGASLILAAFFLSLFVWPVSFAISGETSSIRLRAKSLALRGIAENITSCVISVALPFLYSPDGANIPSKIGLIFFGFGLLVIAASWFTVPETRGLDSKEIDALYEKRR